jgi:hypothetical protein
MKLMPKVISAFNLHLDRIGYGWNGADLRGKSTGQYRLPVRE